MSELPKHSSGDDTPGVEWDIPETDWGDFMNRKTFGQETREVFQQEEDSSAINEKWDTYKKAASEERLVLENLDAERKYFQNSIFLQALNDDPEKENFIKSIPSINLEEPLIQQLIEKTDDGTPKIPDETLGNILEFYQTVIKEKEREFADETVKIQQKYETNLGRRIHNRQLPTAFRDNLARIKRENEGLLVEATKVFDLRPLDEDIGEPASGAAYVAQQIAQDDDGAIISYRRALYRRPFLDEKQRETMGEPSDLLGHEFTHVIAGYEASFNLISSQTGSANVSELDMDTEGQIGFAFREGITEAVGQMIMDDSPEADSRDLRHYLTNNIGTYRSERNFLANLARVDDRIHSNSGNGEETMENLYLEAYAETDGTEKVDALRKRILYILENWENVTVEDDFPYGMMNNYRGRGASWQKAFKYEPFSSIYKR